MPAERPGRASKDPGNPAVEAIQRVGVECRLVIIRHLLERPMRFHELQHVGIGVDAKTLSRVLKYLVQEEIVQREVIGTQPVAVRYSLTEKGQDLRPVIDSLDAWGAKWVLNGRGPVRR